MNEEARAHGGAVATKTNKKTEMKVNSQLHPPAVLPSMETAAGTRQTGARIGAKVGLHDMEKKKKICFLQERVWNP